MQFDRIATNLPPMPIRIARLHRDHRGMPIPWFVAWLRDGKLSEPGPGLGGVPDFRVVDSRKFARALKQPLCWICGETMGVHRVFTIGPMCAVNRIISEPPAHRECAEFSVKACPFLARPRMRRNEKDLPEEAEEAAGFAIKRNPGVICLWETVHYKPFRPSHGSEGILFKLGQPSRVDWYAQGRRATREEVLLSINSGLPELINLANKEGPQALKDLETQHQLLQPLLPV